MKNDSNSYYAVDGFHRSAFAFSSLIFFTVFSASVSAATAKNNFFYNASTKTWIPTSSAFITPQGTVINNSAAAQAQVFLNNGGYSNKSTVSAKFPTVKKTVPVTINARVTPAAVKSAAKKVLKGGAVTLVVGAGLNSLLNGLGWIMGEGGQIQKTVPSGEGGNLVGLMRNNGTSISLVRSTTCPEFVPSGANVSCTVTHAGGTSSYELAGWEDARYLNAYIGGYNRQLYAYRRVTTGSIGYGAVPPEELDSGVDSSYSPTVDDYPALAPYLPPDSTLIDPIPQVNEPPTTVTVTDLDTGKTTTTQINIWHNFDISDNPSNAPKVDVKTTEDTKTYTDGQLTGTSTKTQTSEGDPNQSATGGAAPPPETPIDCDLFPTACAWMEWTKEEPEEPQDNLSDLLKEVPIAKETFTISGGAAACPAPLALNLSQFGSREVSYQPLCDLASTMKFLYLALMSFAAAVLLHRSISRV